MEILARGPANVGDVADAAGVSVSVASRHLREMHAAALVDRTLLDPDQTADALATLDYHLDRIFRGEASVDTANRR